jgi:hypothetical protein
VLLCASDFQNSNSHSVNSKIYKNNVVNGSNADIVNIHNVIKGNDALVQGQTNIADFSYCYQSFIVNNVSKLNCVYVLAMVNAIDNVILNASVKEGNDDLVQGHNNISCFSDCN